MSGTWVPSVVVTLLLSVAVPWIGMRMLAPSLESSARTVTNYRGCRVHDGLGIVWVFWVGGMVLLLIGMGIANRSGYPTADVFASSSIVPMIWATLALGSVMVIPSFVFGMIDDSYGDGSIRGFRGHVRELARGRFSTGGLKLVGIGVASLLVGLVIAQQVAGGVPRVVFAALLIALSANFVNLTDLRPGRALKTYSLMLAGACVMVPFTWGEGPAEGIVGALLLFVAGVGPVAAVWRYDLSERGMLGDAGANPAGALVGVFFAMWWPLWGVIALVVLLGVLNVVSEKVSFSSAIENSTLLRWFDGLGQLGEDGHG